MHPESADAPAGTGVGDAISDADEVAAASLVPIDGTLLTVCGIGIELTFVKAETVEAVAKATPVVDDKVYVTMTGVGGGATPSSPAGI